MFPPLAAFLAAEKFRYVLSLAKKNIDLEVEKGASYKKQYLNKKSEKSREISRG